VRVFDNGSRGSAERLGDALKHVPLIEGDIRDADAVSGAVRGVDGVFHLAYVNGTRHFYERPAHVLDVGIKGMVNVLDACVHAGVGELIVASSSEVYQAPPNVPTDEAAPLSVPDPHNPRYSYGAGKIISEVMALHYGRQYFERVIIFRPHNVYGPNMGLDHVVPEFIVRLRRLMAENKSARLPFPIQGTGEQTRSFVYIDDFTSALMVLREKGQHLNIYNVGTMEEVTIRDVAERIARHLGVCIDLVPGPPAQGATMRRCPDISKLQALGYRPRFAFDDGLRPTVNWYVAQEEFGPAA
jgi:nucleoside-diphosphate-sugar epimerase